MKRYSDYLNKYTFQLFKLENFQTFKKKMQTLWYECSKQAIKMWFIVIFKKLYIIEFEKQQINHKKHPQRMAFQANIDLY